MLMGWGIGVEVGVLVIVGVSDGVGVRLGEGVGVGLLVWVGRAVAVGEMIAIVGVDTGEVMLQPENISNIPINNTPVIILRVFSINSSMSTY
jgi:hypothetical protein